MKIRYLAVVAALSLAACGGGGGGSSAVTPTAPTGPTNTQQHPAASITFNIPIPSRPSGSVRRPQYISPNTSSLEVKVNSVDTGTGPAAPPSWVDTDTTTALTVGGNCTSTGPTETCTVAVPAPVGTVNYTFNATDGTNVLSTATANETIGQGTTNNLSVTLEGVVHTVTVVPASTPVPQSTATFPKIVMGVDAFDADGDLIVDPGNYANPIELSDPETATSGSTTLSSTRGDSMVTGPDDTINLEYGAVFNSFSISASGSIPGGGTIACLGGGCNVTGPTPDDIVFTGTTDDTTPNGGLSSDPNWGQQTLYFSQTSGSQVIGATEVGFTSGFGGEFALSLDPTTCNGVATASGSPGLSFTITATGVGICKAQVSEYSTTYSAASGPNGYPLTNPGHPASVSGNETQNGTFWISVTSSSFGVNSHGRRPPAK